MNQTTKKQHYVWRNYLAPWTQNNTTTGQIWCLRDGKAFQTSLINVAQENYFYEVKELSQDERNLIIQMVIKNATGVQRDVNEQWLNLYCAPFDYADTMSSLGYFLLGYNNPDDIKQDQAFRKWTIEQVEILHGQIESSGLPYISALRQNKLDFWKDENGRDEFSFYLANQYFRTKKIRDALIYAVNKAKEERKYFHGIRPENMWLPLSFIFATNVGAHIADDYSAILLLTEDINFIVGDQPVINTHATYDTKTVPDKLELFYPITPHSALLLTDDSKYTSGQVLQIAPDEVEKYNLLERKSTRETVFAKERTQLDAFISL